MENYISIYEYPIFNNAKIYNNKKKIGFNHLNIQDVNSNYLSFIKNIKLTKTNKRNNLGQCDDDLNMDINENINKYSQLHLNNRSCDIINITYDIVNIDVIYKKGCKKSNFIDNYMFDVNKFKLFYDKVLLNLQLYNNELTNYILQGLYLPEFNYTSCFAKNNDDINCDLEGFVVNNSDFKIRINEHILFETLNKTRLLIENSINDIDNNSSFIAVRKIFYDQIDNFVDINKLNKIVYLKKIKLYNSEYKFCCIGDIHGSLHSLLRIVLRLVLLNYMNKDYILKDNFHIVFLGDLIDRNIYGIDTIFIIMKLYILNPNNVHIIRGNHEDANVNYKYNFYNEFIKITNNPNVQKVLYYEYVRTWINFPSAIYLDNNNKLIQLCHGGFYRDIKFINNLECGINLVTDVNHYSDVQWNDFHCGETNENLLINMKNKGVYGNTNKGRAYYFKTNEVLEYMKNTNMVLLIRGHQDMTDNTKVIIKNSEKCTLPYKKIKPIEELENINNFTSKEDNSYNININNKVDDFMDKYNFPPVITLSTGTSSRFVDGDGFAIINLHNLQVGGLYNNYLKYMFIKNKYLLHV